MVGKHEEEIFSEVLILDNDGTLWVEKPAYIQLFFAIEQLKQLAEADPKLLDKPGFKAAATGDLAYFSRLDPHIGGNVKELMQIVFDSHAGMSQDDFMLMAKEFLETARHPRFGKLYKALLINRWLSSCATWAITVSRFSWRPVAA